MSQYIFPHSISMIFFKKLKNFSKNDIFNASEINVVTNNE